MDLACSRDTQGAHPSFDATTANEREEQGWREG